MKFYRTADPATGEVIDPKETPELYTLDAIRHADVWTPETIKREYQRLRAIAVKRLKRIEESEIGRQSKTYYYNKDKYKPASELKPYEQKILLADLAKMMQAKTGTLTGIKRYRKEAIRTFHEHGYEYVNEQNFNDLGEFFRYWKASNLRGYGSLVAMDVYEKIKNSEAFERSTQKVNKSAEIFRAFQSWQSERDAPFERKSNVVERSSGELLQALDEFLW